jgi:hypothetical protein
MNKRDLISDMAQDTVFLHEDCYDDALIGVIERNGFETVAVYDREKLIKIIMREYDCDIDAAIEHYEYNMLGSYVGPYTPAYLHNIEWSEFKWLKRKYGFVARSAETFRPIWEWILNAKNAARRCRQLRRAQKAQSKKQQPKI